MFFIAHRGNLNGPNSKRENKPDYILEALAAGYDVEVDVWYVNDQMYLGHDGPETPTTMEFLKTKGIWCHAKNISALQKMLEHPEIVCFFFDKEEAVLTSNGYIWTAPGVEELYPKSISIHPEFNATDITGTSGTVTDYPVRYKEMYG